MCVAWGVRGGGGPGKVFKNDWPSWQKAPHVLTWFFEGGGEQKIPYFSVKMLRDDILIYSVKQ